MAGGGAGAAGRRVGAAGHHRPAAPAHLLRAGARTGHHLDAGLLVHCVGFGAVFSMESGELALHALLIAAFVSITVPVSTIFLMRAALFRARQANDNVPPTSAPRPVAREKAPDLIAPYA